MATKTEAPKSKPAMAPLPTYIWEGVDKRGKTMKGEMTGRNEGIVKAELRRMGMDIKLVKPKPKPKSGGKAIKPADIAQASRQMATMMQSGVPLVSALDIMVGGAKNPRLARLLGSVRDSVSGGSSLYEAMCVHPTHFDELFRNLVNAGETAGVLDTVLETVATYKERMESLKGKIKKALFYPAAVICVAMLVSAILLMYVVPQFETLFKGFGADLPAFTQMIVNASKFLQSYWWMIMLVVGGGGFVFVNAYRKSAKMQHAIDGLMLRLPIIGNILHGSAIARFARTLAITFKAGVPLVDALDTVSGATGSETYRKAVMQIKEDVSVGYPVNMAMKQTNLFPHLVVQMVAIGEEAGALDTMLEKVASTYEEEVSNAVDSLSSLLEPFIMVVIGGLVGSMVIGMYLPIFKMADVV